MTLRQSESIKFIRKLSEYNDNLLQEIIKEKHIKIQEILKGFPDIHVEQDDKDGTETFTSKGFFLFRVTQLTVVGRFWRNEICIEYKINYDL